MEAIKIFPSILITLGVLLLLNNFVDISWSFIIPILMIVIGSVKVTNSFLID